MASPSTMMTVATIAAVTPSPRCLGGLGGFGGDLGWGAGPAGAGSGLSPATGGGGTTSITGLLVMGLGLSAGAGVRGSSIGFSLVNQIITSAACIIDGANDSIRLTPGETLRRPAAWYRHRLLFGARYFPVFQPAIAAGLRHIRDLRLGRLRPGAGADPIVSHYQAA